MAKKRVLLIEVIWATALCAQPCLVRDNPGQLLRVGTFAGQIEPKLTPIQPAGRVTVALVPQSIPEDLWRRTSDELAAVHRAVGTHGALTLAVFDGQSFISTASLQRPAAWRKAVDQALATNQGRPLPEPAAFYAAFLQAAQNFGGDWSSVLLVGAPPEPPAEVRDYAAAWFSSQICGQRLRVSIWDPNRTTSEFWATVAAATAGTYGLEQIADSVQADDAASFQEAAWPPPPLDRGFLVYRGKLQTRAGAAPVLMPMMFAAPGAPLPDLVSYAELRRTAKQAAELVGNEKADAAQAQHVRELLEAALRINPLDGEALRAGADFYQRYKDFKTAAMLLAWLKETHPQDGALDAELGVAEFRAGNFEAAEKALLTARERKAGDSAVREALARIHLERKDDSGALRFLDETLALDPRNTDLWFTRADVAGRLHDWNRAADSLEKGLALDGHNLARRTSLIELYLEHDAAERALGHVRRVTAALPEDAAIGRRYAEFLERLSQPEEALAVWKKTLEADPAMEPAHFRVARLLLDKNSVADSLAAAGRGLEAAPKSARLYLLKAEALERQGQYFAARQTLRAASSAVRDEALLARLAEMEDASGEAAAQVYLALADAHANDGARSPQTTAWLERGLEVALRDGDGKSATELRKRLAAATGRGASDQAASQTNAHGDAAVPGGLAGFEFIARFHSKSRQQFFADYCRMLVDQTRWKKEGGLRYAESIHDYFQLLANLKALGTKKGEAIEIVLSASGKKDRQRTEKVLDLLGWKMKAHKDEVTLEAGEKGAQAKRQETASALAIDEVGLQQALEGGQTFRFEIADGSAPILLEESRWMEAFFPKQTFVGGFAEALTHDLRAARIYAALNSMSPRAAAILTAGSDLKLLAEKHADLMYQYSSAFALAGMNAAVPGGPPADAVWEKLAGAPVSRPARFFRAVLEKDDGKLLAFFAMLGQLDAAHQRFLTRTATRTTRFYELFRDSHDIAAGAEKLAQTSSFLDFLRTIPLDTDGSVLFPGGPEVWVLAKGNSTSVTKTAKMARKLARVTVPEQEDEILLRLAGTRYVAAGDRASELDNFVAVVHIDEHRQEPLDEPSALLLAQHYGGNREIYPYFASLTALGPQHFDRFFRLLERLHELSRLQLNAVLGHIHSLTEILCLAQESGALKPARAAEIFGAMADRFDKAAGDADYTRASLDTVREIVNQARPGEGANDPDGAMEQALLEDSAPVSFRLDGLQRELNPSDLRHAAYRKVLQYQKITSLKTLLGIYDAASALAAGNGPAAGLLKTLDTLRGGLQTVDVPKAMKGDEIDRKLLFEFDAGKVGETLVHLNQQTSRKKPNREEIAKLCRDLLALLAPQVKTSLVGVVYAYYFRPGDLLISQDPLLVRKHRFLYMEAGSHGLFCPADLHSRSEGAGSYLVGGFADFPATVGKLAWSGAKPDDASEFVADAQIGSLRAGDWSRLDERDLTRFELRLRVAREWIMHAATDERLFSSLAQDVMGILSPTRGARLLDRVGARDWEEAFQTLTLSDLYSLSTRYLERYPKDLWQSPVTVALRRGQAAAEDPSLLRLGGSAIALQGCSHPHLAPAGPYEEYEKLVLPVKLAERTAEFKLYLADIGARVGIPPPAFNVMAEPAAIRILSTLHMTDIRDWHSATLAFSRLSESALAETLKKDP